MTVIQIIAIGVAALIALSGLYWAIVLCRAVHATLFGPSVRDGLDLPEPAEGWPLVSVIVPAHNEQRVIDACAQSLRGQRYARLELIFVLDRCTDDTRNILERHAQQDERIRIIANDHCPGDWAGKCNAAHIGAEAATGTWLLFTDADTRFDPDLIRASVALARHRKLALLSLLSTLTCEHRYEKVAQPIATMSLVRMFPIGRVNRDDRPRAFANGQFLLFDRVWYEKIGGHATVKDDLLEDIAFARHLVWNKGRCGVALADGMLVVSMYESLDAFKTGWQRIFLEAARRRPGVLRKYGLQQLLIGVLMPLLELASLPLALALLLEDQAGVAAIAAGSTVTVIAVRTVALMLAYRLGGAPRSGIWLFPVGSWIVARIFFHAARDLVNRVPIRWGGREYVLEPASNSATPPATPGKKPQAIRESATPIR